MPDDDDMPDFAEGIYDDFEEEDLEALLELHSPEFNGVASGISWEFEEDFPEIHCPEFEPVVEDFPARIEPELLRSGIYKTEDRFSVRHGYSVRGEPLRVLKEIQKQKEVDNMPRQCFFCSKKLKQQHVVVRIEGRTTFTICNDCDAIHKQVSMAIMNDKDRYVFTRIYDYVMDYRRYYKNNKVRRTKGVEPPKRGRPKKTVQATIGDI